MLPILVFGHPFLSSNQLVDMLIPGSHVGDDKSSCSLTNSSASGHSHLGAIGRLKVGWIPCLVDVGSTELDVL